MYHDYYTKGVLHDGHDSFYLDGKRLVLLTGHYVYDGAVYTVEGDPFTTVTAHGTLNDSTATLWFEVKTPDGMTYKYGESNNSRQIYTTSSGNERINTWYVSTVEDANTNYISYNYTWSNYYYYPISIYYGGNRTLNKPHVNSLSFEYEALGADAQPFVFDGHKGQINVRLKKVSSKVGTSVYRSYELGYSTTSDGSYGKFARLTSVTEKNGDGESMNPITFTWNGLPEVNMTETDLDIGFTSGSPAVEIQSTQLASADLNGDGVDEIIRISYVKVYGLTNPYYRTHVYISRSQVAQDGTVSYQSPITYEIEANSSLGEIKSLLAGTSVIDFDGDGLNDLLIPYQFSDHSEHNLFCRLIYGRDVVPGSSLSYCFSRPLCSGNLPLLTTYDVNGDGLSDILYIEKTANNGKYPLKILYPKNVTDSLADMSFNVSLPHTPEKLFSGDFNGDGLTDIIIFHSTGYKIYYNRGGAISDQKFYEWATTSGTNVKDSWRMEQGDFNGDGLSDFVVNESNKYALFYALSNGDGTFSYQQATTLDYHEEDHTTLDNYRFNIYVNDIDHDGKSDVVVMKTDYTHHGGLFPYAEFEDTYVDWFYSTGSGLSLINSQTTNGEDDALNGHATIGDFNGDGCAELLHYGKNIWDTATLDETKLHVYSSGTDMPSKGRVSRIVDGLGRATDVSYAPLSNPSVYQKIADLQYPVIEKTLPLSVVTQVTASNGAAGNDTTAYQYRGLKMHVRGKGLLGFSGTTMTSTTLGTTATSNISQWHTAKFVPTKTLSTTQTGNDVTSSETIMGVSVQGRNFFAYPTTVTDTDADGNVCQTLTTYDTSLGVPLTRRQNYNNGAMYTQTVFASYVEKGGRQLPQTVTTTQKHSDDNSVHTAVKTFTYDNNGRITSATEHANTDMALTTSFTYDAFGNQLAEVSSGFGVKPVTQVAVYDSSGRFVVTRQTNPATDTHSYYYDVYGNLTNETTVGSRPIQTYNQYDSWGTLLKSTSSDGSITDYSEGWGTSADRKYWRMKTARKQPWVKTWYDECGREVLTESEGPMSVSVSKETEYDQHGRPTLITATTGELSQTETLSYDSRGRVISDVLSSGKSTAYAYGNRSVNITENGRSYSKTFDAWGNVLTATDPVSSVSYTYYSSGLPHSATSAGATVTMGYDAAGHRTLISDPDAGQTTSTWSADGQLLSQTDARGVVTTCTYNDLGLETVRHIGDMTLTNTYGTTADDRLRLLQTTMNGHTVSYGYDSFGRVNSKTHTFADNTALSYGYAYNNGGQISQRVYPGGLTVNYLYDTHGYCLSMTAGGRVVYQLLTATGQQTEERLLGTITKATTLDANGRLSGLTWNKNNKKLENYIFSFDGPTGNLTLRNINPVMSITPLTLNGGSEAGKQGGGSQPSIIDPVFPFPAGSEIFSYDNCDRLVLANYNLSRDSIFYASNGNILRRSGVGYYSYDASERPHAVIGVSNTGGTIPADELLTSFNDIDKIAMTVTSDDGTPVRRVLYGGDYERVVYAADSVREFYYLGHDIIAVRLNGGPVAFYMAQTDHLGSIISVRDSLWASKFHSTYDAWGNPSVSENTIGLLRGYTGHEMLPEYGLINMNGRLYDPQIGRFLSPDNYVQEPGNSQSFNRYTYCLNNPLKYTDPDGESFILIAGCAALFAIGNTVAHALRGDIDHHGFWNNLKSSLKYFSQGAVTGASIGSMYEFAPSLLGAKVGGLAQGIMSYYGYTQVGMGLIGTVSGIANGGMKGVENGAKLLLGNFYLDENDWLGGVWQGFSRHTIGMVQSVLGQGLSQYYNTFGYTDRVDYLGGATFSTIKVDNYKKEHGITLGNFINVWNGEYISGDFDDYVIQHPLYMHEYGHTIDSRNTGPFYLAIGMSSLLSAAKSTPGGHSHKKHWTEKWANHRAARYFSKYYGVDWNAYGYYGGKRIKIRDYFPL